MSRKRLHGQTPAAVKIQSSHLRVSSIAPPHIQATVTPAQTHLSTKTVQRTPLTLERIHDIQTRHRLSLRMLRVRDGVTDDAFEEGLEDAAGFFVDHCRRDALAR